MGMEESGAYEGENVAFEVFKAWKKEAQVTAYLGEGTLIQVWDLKRRF